MNVEKPFRVGYVLKRYPRYSETFIVNEILAHERAGLEIEIFSLYPTNDTHFQDAIARVRASVNYVSSEGLKAIDLWEAFTAASECIPGVGRVLEEQRFEDARNIYQALRIAKAIREKHIHHLHAHFATSATSVARLAARITGIPYTFTAHAKDIFHESVSPNDLHRKLCDASHVVTVSDYNLEFLRRKYGNAARGVSRVYNGLDLERFPYNSPDKRTPLIVSVGRLVEKKGFEALIDACAILMARNLPFHCLIVGEGPLEPQLRERIEGLNVATHVDLVGPRPQIEVIALVQQASVFAAPCVVGTDGNRDGLPTVLLEAMALGTPCISTDVTGIPEVIRNDETGMIVPQHDPSALSEAMEQLLTKTDKRVRLATNARHLIEEKFDIHRNAAEQRSLFKQSRQLEAASPLHAAYAEVG